MRVLQIALVVFIAIATVFVVYLTEHGKRADLQGQFSDVQKQMMHKEDSLRLFIREVSHLKKIVSRNLRERDSLTSKLVESGDRSVELWKTLGSAERRHARAIDSLNRQMSVLESVRDNMFSVMAETALKSTELDLNFSQLRFDADSISAVLDGVYPWYFYYRHEAGRNWAKKLFGAGRGHRLSTEDPWQTGTISENFQAAAESNDGIEEIVR